MNAVIEYFETKTQELRWMYNRLYMVLREQGMVYENARKTSIHLIENEEFIGVYLHKKFLMLHIQKKERLTADKIPAYGLQKIKKMSNDKYMHYVKLKSVNELTIVPFDFAQGDNNK